MSLLRQIRDLKTEYAAVNAHLLRRIVLVNGGIPASLDPLKAQRRTFLDGWMIVGGLPPNPPYEVPAHEKPEPSAVSPEPSEADMTPEDAVIA